MVSEQWPGTVSPAEVGTAGVWKKDLKVLSKNLFLPCFDSLQRTCQNHMLFREVEKRVAAFLEEIFMMVETFSFN